jgi:lysophospholipid acyltransferase
MLTRKDFRRFVRPFFLTPDGQRPTQYKTYYDLASWLTTQLAFSFTTAPFVLLSLPASLQVWSRVYFYAIIGTAAAMAFFASPAKAQLAQRLKARNQEGNPKPKGSDATKEKHTQLMGLPKDPGRDVDEAMKKIREEVESRRRRGLSVNAPTVEEMREMLGAKTGTL